jgi:hypothetical protein
MRREALNTLHFDRAVPRGAALYFAKVSASGSFAASKGMCGRLDLFGDELPSLVEQASVSKWSALARSASPAPSRLGLLACKRRGEIKAFGRGGRRL